MTEVSTIKCNKCGDTIFSRCRHDMRWCSCGSCAIDGGFSGYIKITGDMDQITAGQRMIPQTKEELYNDYNSGTDLYGRLQE